MCERRPALITAFPLAASATGIAVEVVETVWQSDAESLSSCYADSSSMMISVFSKHSRQGPSHFHCHVSPQFAISTCSEHPQ